MNINKDSIITFFKQLKPVDLIYPGIFTIFFIIVGIAFFTATQFISKNINKAFSAEQSARAQALDLARFMLAAKKLNIPVNTPGGNVAVVSETLIPVATTVVPSIPVETTLDKHAITISVQNSTTQKGVASTLAKALADVGFTTPNTGNEKTPRAATVILVKESKYNYASLLLAEVLKTYPNATTATTSESATFDATVIIGGK